MTTLGTRYPPLAYIAGGVGEAEDGIPPQPFEIFFYDCALLQTKIENFNAIPYTSVLPKELYDNIVPVQSVEKSFKHGAVLEVIMAANGTRIKDHRAIATGLGIAGAKRTGNLWAAGPRNMLNISPPGLMTTSPRRMRQCG